MKRQTLPAPGDIGIALLINVDTFCGPRMAKEEVEEFAKRFLKGWEIGHYDLIESSDKTEFGDDVQPLQAVIDQFPEKIFQHTKGARRKCIFYGRSIMSAYAKAAFSVGLGRGVSIVSWAPGNVLSFFDLDYMGPNPEPVFISPPVAEKVKIPSEHVPHFVVYFASLNPAYSLSELDRADITGLLNGKIEGSHVCEFVNICTPSNLLIAGLESDAPTSMASISNELAEIFATVRHRTPNMSGAVIATSGPVPIAAIIGTVWKTNVFGRLWFAERRANKYATLLSC